MRGHALERLPERRGGGERGGKVDQRGPAPPRLAVTRQGDRDRAQAGGDERIDQRGHLPRMPAPAVRQEHGGALAPGVSRDALTAGEEREGFAAGEDGALLGAQRRPHRGEEDLVAELRGGAGGERAGDAEAGTHPGWHLDRTQTIGRAIFGVRVRLHARTSRVGRAGRGRAALMRIVQRLRATRASKAVRAQGSARASASSLQVCW